MKTFKHEWILDPFVDHRTFFTKRMFGGLAADLFERQRLLLVEPTKSGRWNWHGALVCTNYEHHASIQADFPAFRPHPVLLNCLSTTPPHYNLEPTTDACAHHD